VVDKVIGINGKPFDARDFDDENRKAVEKMLFDVADDIDTGGIIPRGMALTIIQEDGEPIFWFGGSEKDLFMLYGSIEAMRQTFWESVIKEKQVDYGE
jgi:hypothetical protein